MNVPIFGEYADVRLLAEMAAEAEAAGWDGFWVWDHIQWSGEDPGEPRQPAVDPIVALTLIAAATQRVRLGPMLTPLARRRPWKVARELTTLDHLSGGRLTLGVGPGRTARTGVRRLRGGNRRSRTGGQAGRRTGRPDRAVVGRAVRLRRAALPADPCGAAAATGSGPVPIWVGGEWPQHRAPFRRAARFHGVHPLLTSVPEADQPAAIRDLVAYIRRFRGRDRPFDVAYGVETAGDGSEADREVVSRFADAGVTWWMEPISRWRGPLTEIRARIRRGPPVAHLTTWIVQHVRSAAAHQRGPAVSVWPVKLREQRVEIPAPDGDIQAIVIEPVGPPPRRGVLYYTDIFQLTESTLRTARQLASAGFLVCLPEIYPRELAGVALEFDDPGKQAGLAAAAAHHDRPVRRRQRSGPRLPRAARRPRRDRRGRLLPGRTPGVPRRVRPAGRGHRVLLPDRPAERRPGRRRRGIPGARRPGSAAG